MSFTAAIAKFGSVFLTSNDDRSERDLLRALELEGAGVTIICSDPSTVRANLRLRTALLCDNQRGGAEALHRQISCSTWLSAVRAKDASSFGDIIDLREKNCARAVAILLTELADRRVTSVGSCRFELAAELLEKPALDAGFVALATRVPAMRSAALHG